MEKGPKSTNSSGISRLKENEIFMGNFPIETQQPFGQIDKHGVNSIVKQMSNSGRYESVRTDQAKNENGKIILGERAIFATPKAED